MVGEIGKEGEGVGGLRGRELIRISDSRNKINLANNISNVTKYNQLTVTNYLCRNNLNNQKL